MACQGTYTTKRLTPSPSCLATCDGCSFSSTVSSEIVDGSCKFTWSVAPSGCGSSAANGVEILSCPGNKTLTFYCDAGETCPAFQIKLKCQPEPA